MKFRFVDEAPANAETYKGLKWISFEDRAGRPYAKLWRNNSKKPYSFYFFSVASRDAWIEKQKQNFDSHEAYKAERKAEAKQRKAEMIEKIEVGQLLHYSWGYEQTNCEFFQVVEKKGSTVKLRRIAGRMDEKNGTGNGMACNLFPVRDKFIGDKVITKRIGDGGIKMDFSYAYICDENRSYYSSWYA